MLILNFIFLHWKLQPCFKHHLHCITFTCHKGLMNINYIQLKNYYYFEFSNVCLIVPYYYKINSYQKACIL
jgi:hypothetical protein